MDSQTGAPDKIVRMALEAGSPAVLICVDDFVGTGGSASQNLSTKLLNRLDETDPSWRDRLLVVYAAVAGFETALSRVSETFQEAIQVVCAQTLTESDRAFAPTSHLFNYSERQRARDVAQRFGILLEKRHPLGYEDSQALVAFYDTVPNNTLPIIWKNGTAGESPWKALLPRL